MGDKVFLLASAFAMMTAFTGAQVPYAPWTYSATLQREALHSHLKWPHIIVKSYAYRSLGRTSFPMR